MTYQVIDWDRNFENDRSRQRKTCSFVCVPNKQHGMGFCRVVSEPDGAAIYGIWQMILGACSQQSQPRHGWLTSNGEQAGSAWGAADLAMKFRRPQKEIDRALEVLSAQEVAWLACHKSPDAHRAVTAQSPPTHLERREEKEEKEENRKKGASVFDEMKKAVEEKQSNPNTNGELDPVFVRDLKAAYRRTPDSRMSHMEESTLAEIIRERPRYRTEWDMIITLKQKEPRYFPQSLSKLLIGWQDTLDRASVWVPEGKPVKSLIEKALDQIQ